jgi:hypothetical protein
MVGDELCQVFSQNYSCATSKTTGLGREGTLIPEAGPSFGFDEAGLLHAGIFWQFDFLEY